MGKAPKFTNEDRIEREVRRRLRDRLAAAGVSEGRIALEVLYWLPEDFCRLYMQLASRALRIDAGVSSSLGGSVGDEGRATKAKVGSGPQRGRTAGGLHTRTSGAHAKGEKGYRTYGTLGSDEALELKKDIDRKLRRIGVAIEEGMKRNERGDGEREQGGGRGVHGVARPAQAGAGGGTQPGAATQAGEDRSEAGAEVERGRGGAGSLNPPSAQKMGLGTEGQTHGDNLRGERALRVGRNGQKRCGTCGKIAKGDWVICPQPHA